MGPEVTKWSTDLKEKEKTIKAYIYTKKSKTTYTKSKKNSQAKPYLTGH